MDAAGHPVAGAKVVVRSVHQGAATTDRGRFILVGIPAGTQTLDVAGPDSRVHATVEVTVRADETVDAQIRLATP